jgi:hypothetical protein
VCFEFLTEIIKIIGALKITLDEYSAKSISFSCLVWLSYMFAMPEEKSESAVSV